MASNEATAKGFGTYSKLTATRRNDMHQVWFLVQLRWDIDSAVTIKMNEIEVRSFHEQLGKLLDQPAPIGTT